MSESKPAAASANVCLRHDVRADDSATVRRIVESTRFFSAAEVEIAVELVDQRWEHGESSGYSFVFVELDGETVAYACYGPIACTVASFDLYWIAVDPSVQRQRIGHLLIEEVERLVRQAAGRQIYIETASRSQYAPTRKFYERCGYQCVSVLDDFYAMGDDKVTYRKLLET